MNSLCSHTISFEKTGQQEYPTLESYHKFIVKLMSGLDLSDHQLNVSSTKQRYSFPRQSRFNRHDTKPLCQSFYDIPSTIAKRTTSLGLGKKDMGLNSNINNPGAGTYQLPSQFNPQKHKYSSVAFGFGREKMELSGPLGQVKYFSKMPGPGAYNNNSTRDMRAPSLRSRLPDHEFQKSTKNPGPGTYKHENLGATNYYITSKYRNYTNRKISQVARLDPISKKQSVGPSDYNDVDRINSIGRYSLAKHASASSCVFSRSPRQGLVEKFKSSVPGPGHFSFSSFG